MMYLGGLVVLVGALQLLVASRRPLLCGAIYAVATSMLGLISGVGAGQVLLTAPLVLVGAAAFFWVVDRVLLD